MFGARNRTRTHVKDLQNAALPVELFHQYFIKRIVATEHELRSIPNDT